MYAIRSYYEDYQWSSYYEYINKPVIADTDFALQILSTNMEKAIKSFIVYSNEFKDDKCMDYDERTRLSDNEVKDYLAKLGFQSKNELQQMDRSNRNESYNFV